jgi:surface protein pspA
MMFSFERQNKSKGILQMKKKKVILTSLASAALLGAGFIVSQSASINAAETNEVTANSDENATLKAKLDELEKAFVEGINSNTEVSPEEKAKAIQKIKEAIAEAKQDIDDPSFSLEEFVNTLTDKNELANPLRKKEEVESSGDKEKFDKLDEAHENKLKREKEEKAELERLKSEMDKLKLNTEAPAEKRTEWVVKTTEGNIVAISVNTEKAEVTLNDNKATMEKAGFTYKNSVTEGTVTRHIFSTEKSITERTIWYDTEGNILFEEKGLQDPEYQNHHETLVAKGYELIDSGQFDSHDEGPTYSETVFGYLYKKVSNSTTTTPETRPNFRYPEVKPETKQDTKSETKQTVNESKIKPQTSKENVKSTETKKEETTVETPKEEVKSPEVKKEELPKTGMADSFGTIAAAVTSLVAGLGFSIKNKKDN